MCEPQTMLLVAQIQIKAQVSLWFQYLTYHEKKKILIRKCMFIAITVSFCETRVADKL